MAAFDEHALGVHRDVDHTVDRRPATAGSSRAAPKTGIATRETLLPPNRATPAPPACKPAMAPAFRPANAIPSRPSEMPRSCFIAGIRAAQAAKIVPVMKNISAVAARARRTDGSAIKPSLPGTSPELGQQEVAGHSTIVEDAVNGPQATSEERFFIVTLPRRAEEGVPAMDLSPIRAVLFDFHQTLFQVEHGESWLAGACDRIGRDMTEREITSMLAEINAARDFPDVVEGQRGRDLSAAAHRKATVSWLLAAGVDEALAGALYERLLDPCGWHPYRDTADVLAELTRRGIPVGVISNTGWDIRETFAYYSVAGHVKTFTLSCEHGMEKPDPKFFRRACAELSSVPEETLMVGDNPASDGGAIEAGMHVYLFPAAPPSASRGLRAILRLAGSEGH
jgi:HAD superfamily hydrolase (TIGR01549 family)